MAIYTYQCDRCELRREVWHKMNESPTIKCENCIFNMKRIITGGGGFKINGTFHSMTSGVTRKADLKDHIQEVKKQGKEDAAKGRDMSMPRSTK